MVAATNSNGEPDFFFVKVDGTEEQIEHGWHYDAAKDEASEHGYEPYLVYDENCSAGKALMEHFVWESASTVQCPHDPFGLTSENK